VYLVTCHPALTPSQPSWKKKPFVGKRAVQLASPTLLYTRHSSLETTHRRELSGDSVAWLRYIIYNIILYYIWCLFLPFVFAAALVLYYVFVRIIISNYKRQYWISRDASETHLTNFSSHPRVHPILHPTHTFTRRRRQSFVNRPGYPDVFPGKIYNLI